jgi:hypothetical protein
MKRVLLVLTCVALLFSMAGPASGAVPTGVPELNATPLWWKYCTTSATAFVSLGPAGSGFGGHSLLLQPGNRTAPGQGGQAIVSTSVGAIPNLTSVADFTKLAYSTYVLPTSAHVNAPTIQISTDIDGNLTWDTNLVFVPGAQAPPSGQDIIGQPVLVGQWQRWTITPTSGLWYSTQPIPTADEPDFATPANPKTLDQIELYYPFAAVSLLPSDPGGHIRIQYGSSGGDAAGDRARVDGVTIESRFPPDRTYTANFQRFLGTTTEAPLNPIEKTC